MNTGIGVSSCMRTMYLSLILLAFITHINSQTPQTRFNVGNCPPVRTEDLGRTDILSTEGVVASVLRTRFHQIPHKVQILDHQMVCQAAGLIKGTVSAISVVVRYQCEGEHCRNTSEIFVEYLNLDCNKSPPSFLLPSPNVQRGAELSPGNPSDLSLPLNTMCGECTQIARVPGHCVCKYVMHVPALSLYVLACTYMCLHELTCTCMYLHEPTCTCMYLHVPA